jgi:hypothetical protein
VAQIFLSHIAKDKDLAEFLSKAFASTQVKALFEEFEAVFKEPALLNLEPVLEPSGAVSPTTRQSQARMR